MKANRRQSMGLAATGAALFGVGAIGIAILIYTAQSLIRPPARC